MGWAIDGETDVYSWDATLRMFKAANIDVIVLCPKVPYSSGEDWVADKTISDSDLIQRKMQEVTEQLDKSKWEEK